MNCTTAVLTILKQEVNVRSTNQPGFLTNIQEIKKDIYLVKKIECLLFYVCFITKLAGEFGKALYYTRKFELFCIQYGEYFKKGVNVASNMQKNRSNGF